MGITNSSLKVKLYSLFKNPILYISIVYFVTRLASINSIPPWNDESIYIDWGWRMINAPGFLFYSYYDAKPPLMMWLFGLALKISPADPIFSARLVSVLFGYFTLIGVYRISSKYVGKGAGWISGICYIIIPIFLLFDRQTLLEVGISAVGIWLIYYALRYWETNLNRYLIILGFLFAIGYLIKSNSLVFMFSFIIISIFRDFIYKTKSSPRVIGITGVIFFITTFLIYLQPIFWESIGTNSRYTITFSELVKFPVSLWLKNFYINLRVISSLFGIQILIASIFGFYLIIKDKKKNVLRYLVCYMILNLALQTLLVKESNQRYVMPYIPGFIIGFSYFVNEYLHKKKIFKVLILFLIISTGALSILLILRPQIFMKLTDPISGQRNYEAYFNSDLSGVGLDILKKKIEYYSRGNFTLVAIPTNIGNPESYLQATFVKNNYIEVGYLEASMLGNDLNNYDCLETQSNLIFISRNDQLAGLNKYLEIVDKVYKPDGKFYYGIWKLKNNCNGKKLELSATDT